MMLSRLFIHQALLSPSLHTLSPSMSSINNNSVGRTKRTTTTTNNNNNSVALHRRERVIGLAYHACRLIITMFVKMLV